METQIDNATLTNDQIASQYEPMRPIAFVRTFSQDGTPCGVITCFNAQAIVYAVGRVRPSDSVRVQPCGAKRFTRRCDHDNQHYEHNRCFECWKADREERREEYRATLRELLAGGVTVLESWPSGLQTDWAIDLGSRTAITLNLTSHNRGSLALDADALARHLESRSDSFGTMLQAYCYRCGETLLAIGTPDDPICPACAARDVETI